MVVIVVVVVSVVMSVFMRVVMSFLGGSVSRHFTIKDIFINVVLI